MSILLYRDRDGLRDLVGQIDYENGKAGTFLYDTEYLARSQLAGELGISELLPLDPDPFSAEEFGAFFRGLLPEGEIYGNLSELYQIPRSDYLGMLEQMGCESIGALTFISDRANPDEYEPRYEEVPSGTFAEMSRDPVRLATITASSTRLSLSGAQSKVAWFLPQGIDAGKASHNDWRTPLGTAPSTHIIKISRTGEEAIALNELACSLLAAECGIETAKAHILSDVPGVIAVERYDRAWLPTEDGEIVARLHQEDFCQALGLAPFFKYQPAGVAANYPAMMADLVESTCENPLADKLDLARRLVFCYAVGNSDAHLKNFSLLYNHKWTGRKLAPLYDVTCIPLTGYSAAMPFDIGRHRALNEIDERDLVELADDLDTGLDSFSQIVQDVVTTLSSPTISPSDKNAEDMAAQILENSLPRIKVLEGLLGR